MFRRWRQENYFKYMDAEFALDALVEYGVDEYVSIVANDCGAHAVAGRRLASRWGGP
jgi:hypothetical protein